MDDQTGFDFLYDGLTKNYPGLIHVDGSSDNFQFMQSPQFANWTTGTDADAYSISNSGSTDLGGFYIPSPGFAQNYKDLVTSIAPSTGSDNQDYKDIVAKIAKATKQNLSIVATARTQYAVYKAQQGANAETFDVWITDSFGGKSYGDQINSSQTNIDNLTTTQTAIIKALDGPLSDAQSAVNPFTPMMTIAAGGGATQSVPLSTISGDLQADIANWETYAPGKYDFQMNPITKNSVTKTPWKTTYKTTVSQHCASTNATTKVDTSRFITDSKYKLEVMAVGVNSYNITHGSWYHPAFVASNAKIVEGSAFTDDSFFGVHGLLHLVPVTIFVMYKPTIKLTITTSLFKQKFSENATANINWIDLMSFRFKFDGVASLQPVESGGATTVKFSAPDNQFAQIVGITSQVFWNGNS